MHFPTVRNLTFSALAAALLISAVGAVIAEPMSPPEIIKMRQDNLKAMGGAMKAIVDQLKSGAPDKAIMADNAKKIAMYAHELPQWFPKGTGEEAGVKTAAKPEIWTQRADFDAAAAKLPPEADKLVQVVASGDSDAIGAQMKATGAACGGCHKVFRVPPQEQPKP